MNKHLPIELIELTISKTNCNLLRWKSIGLSNYYLRKLIKHRRLCDLIDIRGNNNSDSIKYLRSLNFQFTTDDLEMAACVGNLDLVIYLHKVVGVECTSDSFDLAAEGDFLEICKYMHSSCGISGSEVAYEVAYARDYHHLVNFLHSIGCTEQYDRGFGLRWS
jgi:hypothetical protein